jgi:hypothetical protein
VGGLRRPAVNPDRGYGPRVPRFAAVVAVVAALMCGALAGCSSSGGSLASGGCQAPHTDLLDIRSTLHLLPGAPDPPYSTYPPTSGAHRVGYYPRGVVASPVGLPVQVGLLEKGFVMVQYRADLGPAAEAALAPLTAVTPYLTLAPDPTLQQEVVATSWLHDLRCGGYGPAGLAALRRFITARVGQGTEPLIPLAETVPGGVTTTTSPTA